MISIKRAVKKSVPDWVWVVAGHARRHRRLPNLIWPVAFNEKVLHRILFDRRPILSQMADKAAVRSYVEDRLGAEILPSLYWLTDQPDNIPFDSLPDKFVVKPNHASGWIQFVRDKSTLDRQRLVKTCQNWLNRSFYEITREWAYKNIKPKLLVEELVQDGERDTPDDYKFFVFDGEVKLIQVDRSRFVNHRRSLYTPDWKKLDVVLDLEDIDEPVSAPIHLNEMLKSAQILGKGIDFIRADFYDTGKRIYFGELTTTPAAGTHRFTPRSFDWELGESWKIGTS